MTVHLVATGPGDPALLTVQIEELLRAADAVAHEPAVSADILMLVAPDAKVVEVDGDDHGALIALGSAYECVVRLGTGDRLALQAGGAEAAALRAGGIEVTVLPVVLAAFSLPVRRGLPVMTRDLAPVLTVVVGTTPAHEHTDNQARPGTTVVTLPDASAPTMDIDGAVTALDLRHAEPGCSA